MEAVARELGLLVRSLKNLHHEVLDEVGVRVEMPAAAVLSTLNERGRMRPSAIAEVLHLDLSSVSRQVASLEREGWLFRERDPHDYRAALVDLTPPGRAVLHEVRAASVAHLRRLLPDWHDDELEQFAAQLHRLRTDLARTPDDGDAPETTTNRVPTLAGQEI